MARIVRESDLYEDKSLLRYARRNAKDVYESNNEGDTFRMIVDAWASLGLYRTTPKLFAGIYYKPTIRPYLISLISSANCRVLIAPWHIAQALSTTLIVSLSQSPDRFRLFTDLCVCERERGVAPSHF